MQDIGMHGIRYAFDGGRGLPDWMNDMVVASERTTAESSAELTAALCEIEADHAALEGIARQCGSGYPFAVFAPGGSGETCGRPDSGAEAVADLLSSLLDLAWRHAAREERLMKRLSGRENYLVAFGAHVEDHANLSAELVGLVACMRRSPSQEVLGEVRAFVRRWLDHHVACHDRLLIQCAKRAMGGSLPDPALRILGDVEASSAHPHKSA